MILKLQIFFAYFLLSNFSLASDNGAIEITANKMEWNKSKNIVIAIGNAKAIKGKMVITANKIIANITNNEEADEISALNAEGRVNFKGKNQTATGQNAYYDLNKDVIILTGNVSLEKLNNVLVGDKLVIDFKTGVSKLTGKSENNKVKMKYNTPEKVN